MTRKQALEEAIKVIEKSDIDSENAKCIIEKLNLCISELPFAKWTEAAIFDACDQFIADHGRPLRLRDFVSKELPSHPTVKNRFGISLKEFRDKYYPLPPGHQDIAKPDPDEVVEAFRKEMLRCEAHTMEEYSKRKSPNAPCVTTVIKNSRAGTWLNLLKRAGIEPKTPAKRVGLQGYAVTMHFLFEEQLADNSASGIEKQGE